MALGTTIAQQIENRAINAGAFPAAAAQMWTAAAVLNKLVVNIDEVSRLVCMHFVQYAAGQYQISL